MRRRSTIVAASAALALLALGIGSAVAAHGDDSGGKATTRAERKAVAAALRATGGGTANAVERDSEDGATWEVEVAKPGGGTVDVRLDASYGVVVIEGDSEAGDGND
jgi:uncharacterized membrane protein YkoI